MISIFISYSRKNSDIADVVRARLDEEKYRVWVDSSNIPGGEEWKKAIVTAIGECDVFILVLTRNSAHSRHVVAELGIAKNRDKPIIALNFVDAEIPEAIEYDLSGTQQIDFSIDFERGMTRLLKDIPGAKAIAKKAAIQYDEAFFGEDKQFLLQILDLEELDTKTEKLLEKLVDLDRESVLLNKNKKTAESHQKKKDDLYRQLDEIKKIREVKIQKCQRETLLWETPPKDPIFGNPFGSLRKKED